MLEHMPEHYSEQCVEHYVDDSAIDHVNHNESTYRITYQNTIEILTVVRYIILTTSKKRAIFIFHNIFQCL